MDANGENEMTEPIMDGSGDATNKEKFDGLLDQVEHDRGAEGDEAKERELQMRMGQSGVRDERGEGGDGGAQD